MGGVTTCVFHIDDKMSNMKIQMHLEFKFSIYMNMSNIYELYSLIIIFNCIQFSSVPFSRSVVSDSLQPHELQHARPPSSSPTPRVYSNSCPSSG